jgi:hypothetical protein
MAYDTELANRLRETLAREENVTEKAMFGGLAFLINGNLAVSASSTGGILLRVEPADTASLLKRAHVEPFITRGRALDGWIRVDVAGLEGDRTFDEWLTRGISFARSLPPK